MQQIMRRLIAVIKVENMKKTISAALLISICFSMLPAGEDLFVEGESAHLQQEGETEFSCEIRDAFGSPVQFRTAADGRIDLSLLPAGYYRLRSDGREKTFCILAKIRKEGVHSPFGIDVAVRGGLGPFKGRRAEGLQFYRRLLKNAGGAAIRERFYWSEIECTPGKLDFRSTENVINSLCGDEIDSSMVISNPPHFRTVAGDLSRDLVAVYRFARASAERFRGRVLCWEFWNEQDLSPVFGSAPWKFTALQKAAYLGCKAGDPDTPVSAGSFSLYPVGDGMISGQMFAGDMAEYCDLFNYHIYAPLREYPAIFDGIRRFLREELQHDMPIWVTEYGTHAEGNATEKGISPGTPSLNAEQEMLWSEFLPKAAILLQQNGVTRSFAFVLRRHIEQNGLKEWGMLRKDLSVKPLYAAYAVLNREIGSAKLCGELKLLPKGRCFVYRQPDGTCSLVLWNRSGLEEAGGVLQKGELSRRYDSETELVCRDALTAKQIFGTPVALKRRAGRMILPVTRYPLYVHGLKNVPEGIEPPEPEGRKPAPRSDLDKAVVLDADVTGENSLLIRITNLDEREKRIRLSHNFTKAEGIPQILSIGAFAAVQLPVTKLKLEEDGAIICGTANDKKITRCFIPPHFFQMRSVPLSGADSPSRWRKHSSGEMSILWDENVRGLKIDGSFPRLDRWIYPRFIFVAEERELLKQAVGISFAIRTEQTRKTLSSPSLVWVIVDGKKYRFSYRPSTGEWVENKILFPKGRVEGFEIGMNPKKEKITYWIRNVRLLYSSR